MPHTLPQPMVGPHPMLRVDRASTVPCRGAVARRTAAAGWTGGRRILLGALACALQASAAGAQVGPLAAPPGGPVLAAGSSSGLPLVEPNDNRTAAGTVGADGVRELDLEILEADWRLETTRGPGLRVAAVAEVGSAPSIPAPLLRVEEGTRIRVTVHNRLDRPLLAYGLHTRPLTEPGDTVTLAPGATETVTFEAGAAGTYMYGFVDPETRARAGRPEREQLAGAFVVDPPGGATDDRVLVINVFSEPTDSTDFDQPWWEGLAINGRSWPFTERLQLEVGRRERWRVVNASIREHPMHLHGFFFDVLARGDARADTLYQARDHRAVVTESMLGGTTMLMEWTPTRPGRWLFHCHLAFHVGGYLRLPGAREADPEHAEGHMAGLVMGLEVAPGPTDIVAHGPPVEQDLWARYYGEERGFRYGFALDPDAEVDSLTEAPGPLLVFHQDTQADITVHNGLPRPTAVHWHGLELDAWADGVPLWSASDGRMSPVIQPGESFTYRLSFLRPGTFIYHSHLNDIDQLTGGLYGALVVLPPGATFDPNRDHVRVWGWNDPAGSEFGFMDLNGRRVLAPARARVGETHRFRLVHIAPAGMITAWITRGEERIPIVLKAKDGADLPPSQQVAVDGLARIGVGETADFLWVPSEPGTYQLRIGYSPDAHIAQEWVVEAGDTGGPQAPAMVRDRSR